MMQPFGRFPRKSFAPHLRDEQEGDFGVGTVNGRFDSANCPAIMYTSNREIEPSFVGVTVTGPGGHPFKPSAQILCIRRHLVGDEVRIDAGGKQAC